MKSLAEQLDAYAAYHADPRNKLTHFVGVPLVTFALFLLLGWLRFAPAPEAPLTAAEAVLYGTATLTDVDVTSEPAACRIAVVPRWVTPTPSCWTRWWATRAPGPATTVVAALVRPVVAEPR